MLRIAIVDDDTEDLHLLEDCIRRFFDERAEDCALFAFSDGEELLYRYDGTFDLIFLDVEMRWSNGLDIARSIRQRDRDTVLIFVSRIARYAVEGYSVDAMDYLLKPVEYAVLEKKLQKALNYLASRRSGRVRISADGDYRWLSTDSIRYVEVYGHSLIYHTTEGDFRVSGAIAAAAEELAPYYFVQCARFSLVNLKYVTGIDGTMIYLGADAIPISRRRRKELVNALLLYNGGQV